MNYNEILRKKAESGFEVFVRFIRYDKNLIYEVNETDEDETEIEVSIFDENEGIDILGTYYFDNEGTFIREV